MAYPIKAPRKLIEVALPLDAINLAAAKEKSIRYGHPSALHLWWARRPLAVTRAVIFAQLVNDPGYQQGGGFRYGKNKKEAAAERKRLFKIIEDLVVWENTTNEDVLKRARIEIARSWREVCELNHDHPLATELFNPDVMPGLHDPFAGGGAIPLEAQRLGLASYASDLNPVAVMINKAMIEIPAKFIGRAPVGPPVEAGTELLRESGWAGAMGLAEDIRRYGAWMRREAYKRIGYLYPPAEITRGMAKDRPELRTLVGKKLKVIAWLWTRTLKCPNPGCEKTMPLLSSFVLSSKKGREAYLVPIVSGKNIRFDVANHPPEGDSETGYKRGKSGIFECAFCGTVTSRDYTAEYATASGLGSLATVVVCDSPGGRIYLPAEACPLPKDIPLADTSGLEIELAPNPRDVWCRNFGLKRPADLFTSRQLVGLTTYSDLVGEVRELVLNDALAAGMDNDKVSLDRGGMGAAAYAEAICVYLALGVSKLADAQSSLCRWKPSMDQSISTFGRQALPMVWDYSEANLFGEMAGDFMTTLENMMRVLDGYKHLVGAAGTVVQADAQTQTISRNKFISTDPPYYDNIGYADLSDFFYVWLRRILKGTFPNLLATMAVPKAEELVAVPYRHGSREEAEAYFLKGMTQAMHALAQQAHPSGPLTIYYAFKQSETESESGTSSTGWETFLESVHRAGLQLTGTWPMRTELSNRMISAGTNALASSIVLVCRNRAVDAPSISRREFIRELNQVLPEALDEMTKGSGGEYSPVAPVDLSQAIIGPGMAVFSKYAAVLEADGSPMSVRTALQLINRFFAEDDFDADSQFCLRWFEQHGWAASAFGEADVLARSKSTSVDAMKEAGVLQSGGGKVRLLKWSEYPSDWDPRTDTRTPVWEALHQLIRALKQGGESASGALLAALGGKAEAVRQLAYRLYTLCERLGNAEDARAYNELITSWTGIEAAAAAAPKSADGQLPGFES